MSPQQSIAHYRISAKLGEGGMGAVYRATDTKLNREVAIKILPDTFAADPDRMARFQREAQVLASLNHPNIAHIYGVEERALVLELVEGLSLDERIAQGPIPLDEAVPLARQIAEALEYAHERGIVHRDLKPANIKLTSDGRVKVLDFGLAKAMSIDAPAGADAANSPTLTMRATMAGVILGTASYMAPEQAKGKPVDRRADIWAFGIVLMEMLTGRPMYSGETVSETLAAVIMKEPDLSALPAATPSAVRSLLARCLDRDPLRRLRDIGEARVLLERPPADQTPAAAPAARTAHLPWIAAAAFAFMAAALAVIHFRESTPPAPAMRFSILPPDKEDFGRWMALSPDGRLLAFTLRGGGKVWIRSLESTEARALAGTEGANTFFWSPDSRFLVFSSTGKIRKIEVSGGPAEPLCDFSGVMLGGSWSSDGVILFGGANTPIMRLPASGGTPAAVTIIDRSHEEVAHLYPAFLSDGRHFVYVRSSSRAEFAGLFVGSVDTNPEEQSRQRVVSTAPISFAFVPPRTAVAGRGRLLYLREGSLLAQAFDEHRLQGSGDAVPVAQGVVTNLSLAAFTVSATGILAYRTGGAEMDGVQYRWFDRQGKDLGLAGASNGPALALSPDNSRVAHSQSALGQGTQIWVLDLARGVNTRFSFAVDGGTAPVWSADSKWIAFSSSFQGSIVIYLKESGGGAPERVLFRSYEAKRLEDWSRDGKFLLYRLSSNQTARMELWALQDPLAAGEHKPVPVAASSFDLSQGRISPDSRLLAYVSNESGRNELYVRPFPPGDGRTGQSAVSSGGGFGPVWRADGRELYYVAPNGKLMAVDVTPGAAFHAGVPHPLFTLPFAPTSVFYDVAHDGKRFLISVPVAPQGAQTPASVIVNWESALRK